MKWVASDMPDLTRKTVMVTGANSGLGFAAGRALAVKRAHVVLACRNTDKAEVARQEILANHPGVRVEVMILDLASLSSVRAFAELFASRHDRLDLLCNNAGVMALPRRETPDGFEMQFGTNHLGHFALTGLLLPLMLSTPGARIVTQSSFVHLMAPMDLDDLHGKRRYERWRAYRQSKLANLLFAYELQRRLDLKGASAISVACHPGYTATELHFRAPRMERSTLKERLWAVSHRLMAQDSATGALPMLYAATAPDVCGGDYIGPDSFGGLSGHPRKSRSSSRSHDPALAARLWDVSQQMTAVRY